MTIPFIWFCVPVRYNRGALSAVLDMPIQAGFNLPKLVSFLHFVVLTPLIWSKTGTQRGGLTRGNFVIANFQFVAGLRPHLVPKDVATGSQ